MRDWNPWLFTGRVANARIVNASDILFRSFTCLHLQNDHVHENVLEEIIIRVKLLCCTHTLAIQTHPLTNDVVIVVTLLLCNMRMYGTRGFYRSSWSSPRKWKCWIVKCLNLKFKQHTFSTLLNSIETVRRVWLHDCYVTGPSCRSILFCSYLLYGVSFRLFYLFMCRCARAIHSLFVPFTMLLVFKMRYMSYYYYRY